MAGSTRRVAWAALALGGALGLVGCSGDDSDVATFTADVRGAENAQALFNESLLRAVELCGAEEPPLQVEWTFAERDQENPVAQAYIRDGFPSFIPCQGIQGGHGGSQLPGAAPLPTPPGGQAQEDGPAGTAPASTAP